MANDVSVVRQDYTLGHLPADVSVTVSSVTQRVIWLSGLKKPYADISSYVIEGIVIFCQVLHYFVNVVIPNFKIFLMKDYSPGLEFS